MTQTANKFKKLAVTQLSSDFRKAVQIVEATVPEAKPNQVLVRVHYVGINASDVNYSAGKYLPGVKPPFDAGFEGCGIVQHVGSQVKHLKTGDAVAFTVFGAFAEYIAIDANMCWKVPECTPSVIPLFVSGLTASIALEKVGEIKSKQTVLITAGAGATGVFAVQLAKLAGNHVIATCSSDDKVEFLKKLGCNRVINYKKENIDAVLTKEYPKGLDVVYESVGGEMYETCVKHLARFGKLIIIGFISGYQDQSGWKKADGSKPRGLPIHAELLRKSASIRGFFLNDYMNEWRRHYNQLWELIKQGKLQPVVDNSKFEGLEKVCDAIDYMYAGKNVGKVIVQLSPVPSSSSSSTSLNSKL